MGFFSKLGGAIASAGRAVVSVAKTVVSAAKKVAEKAICFLADHGEQMVEKVKETWARVSPILRSHVKPFLDKLDLLTKPIPWLNTAVVAINKGLEALLALENSPILKKVEKAIRWAIDKAKHYKETYLSKEEIKDAEAQRTALHEASEKLMDAEQRKAFSLSEMIHDFVIARSAIRHIFEDNAVADFDHYLRLRATQKLLHEAESTIDKAMSVEDISVDDIFLLHVASNLISETPTLSDADAATLEGIVQKRFQKPLLVFVFEEMVMAWSNSLDSMEKEWAANNQELARNRTILRRMEIAEKLGQELEVDEKSMTAELRKVVPEAEASQASLEDRILAKKKYIYASEGFLQVLEKPEEYYTRDGHEFLAEGARKIGGLIVDLAQADRPWSSLNEEEQGLINDYANIFEADSKARAEQLVRVAV